MENFYPQMPDSYQSILGEHHCGQMFQEQAVAALQKKLENPSQGGEIRPSLYIVQSQLVLLKGNIFICLQLT